jgi:hypothetical protein
VWILLRSELAGLLCFQRLAAISVRTLYRTEMREQGCTEARSKEKPGALAPDFCVSRFLPSSFHCFEQALFAAIDFWHALEFQQLGLIPVCAV